jgi:hypothetical protein
MPISDVARDIIYTGNGATTEWNFTFQLADADDVKLLVRAIATGEEIEIDSADFEVVAESDLVGGVVTYPLAGDAVEATHEVVVYVETPRTQEVEITNQTAFYPSVVRSMVDKLTMLVQELYGQLGRAVQTPIGIAGFSISPGTEGEAPVFDADGNLTAGVSTTAISDAAVNAATAAAAAESAEDDREAVEALLASVNTTFGDDLIEYDNDIDDNELAGGMYRVTDDATGTKPDGLGAFNMLVFHHSNDDQVTQLVVGGSGIAWREYNAPTWGSWNYIADQLVASDALIQQTIRDAFDAINVEYGTVVGHYTLLGNLVTFEFRAEEVYRGGSFYGGFMSHSIAFELPISGISTDGASVTGTCYTDLAHGADHLALELSGNLLTIYAVTGTSRTQLSYGDLDTSPGNTFYFQGTFLLDPS